MTHPALDPVLRTAGEADAEAIATLLGAAFGQDAEARLVHELRACGAFLLERVAIDPAGRLVGYVGFSRVTGAGAAHRLAIACLAPVAVSPDRRKAGIASALIRDGLATLAADGIDLVLVLGPPAFFPRFGFSADLARHISGPYAGAAFQALALDPAVASQMPIEVTFATPFEAFE